MALRLSCPCGNKIILTGAPRERAGKTVACPACKRKLAIPDVPEAPPVDNSTISARAMGLILLGAGFLLLGLTLIVWQTWFREADQVADKTAQPLAQNRVAEKKGGNPVESSDTGSRGQPLPNAPPAKKIDEAPKPELPKVEAKPTPSLLPPIETKPTPNVIAPLEVKPKPGVIPPLEVKGKANVMEQLVLRWALSGRHAWMQRFAPSRGKVEAAVRSYPSASFLALLLARATPLPDAPLKVVAAVVGYPILRYSLAVFLGALPYFYVLALVGGKFRVPTWILIVAAILIALGLLFDRWRSHARRTA